MKKTLFGIVAGLAMLSSAVMAENYTIDTEGQHAFVQFRVKHLGYSWLYGRFNDFSGEFSYDADKPSENKIEIDINMASVDTNHAERDKHIRSDDFLNTDKYPNTHFASTGYTLKDDNTAELTGDLTFNGVTKSVTMNVARIGGGQDPWGGYRQGFEGGMIFKPADFGFDIAKNLGPSAAEVELILSIEGIRQ